MTVSEVSGMLKQYFIAACFGVILLVALLCIGYFLVYKRWMKGGKTLTIGKAAVLLLLAGYLFAVLYATFFARGAHYLGSPNLHLFSSYRGAWNSFTLRSWQLLIFNIALFIPLGALLPLLKKRFAKPVWTVGAGFLFSLAIELIQLFSGRGSFDLDDLFNNFVGTVVGYCLVMAVLTAVRDGRGKAGIGKDEKGKAGAGKGRKAVRVICFLIPVLLVAGGFGGIFIKYHTNEFGNLVLAYDHKMNCKNARIESDVALSDRAEPVMVYRTVVYNKTSGLEHAKELFEGFGISADHMEVAQQYNDNAIYEIRAGESSDVTEASTDGAVPAGRSYSLWLDYSGGTYRYHYYDPSSIEEEAAAEAVKISEDEARALLARMQIYIPENAEFAVDDQIEAFTFNAELAKGPDAYYTGQVRCSVDKDHNAESLSNNLISLEEYRTVEVKSQREAFEEIKQGKFKLYLEEEEIKSMRISGVTTGYSFGYSMDSKGFYQPLYQFQTTINGKPGYIISIPARK